MKQANDILAQEPQVEPVQEQNLGDVKGYIAYLNLDWLNMIFADEGWQGDVQRQEGFIASLQNRLADVVLRHKKNMMLTYSWYDKENRLCRAIEVMPVSAAAAGLQIVTPDVSGYEELNKRLTELERENIRLKNQIRSIGEDLRVKGVITERAFRAYFDRQPSGLVEKFREEMKEVRESAERGDYKAPAGLCPVRVLTAVNDKIVENVNGRTVERIKIMFPCEATDEEKDFIRQSVMKYTDEILNGDPCECAWKVLADDLYEEWMAKYRNRYNERHAGIYITPYKGGTKVVAYMVR